MFGSNTKNETQSMSAISTEATGPGGINSLGAGSKVVGDLNASSDIRLDGELEGNLKCGGKLILGPKGNIKGEIDCQNAVVEGTIHGQLRVRELLHVKESAHITGQITTSKLMVQSGAVFNVKCEMGGQKIAPKTMVPAVKSA